jgi:enolase
MAKISKVTAREILDSRGNPTLEVDVVLDDGSFARAGVPSGASTGAHEAVELRDGDKARYQGKGVRKAVTNVRESLAPKVIGLSANDQAGLDHFMIKLDGTENKAKFGANAILGVSLAVARANAVSQKVSLFKSINKTGPYKLPVPLMNVINGGAHADNGLDVQEFMIVPVCGGRFSEALRAGSEIFHTLKSDLKKKGLSTGVGDEGGFAPVLKSNQQALELLSEAVTKAGYKLGTDIFFALDAAATELYDSEKKTYRWEKKTISSDELTDIYGTWAKNFPLISIEDGLSEDDWDGWKSQTAKLGKTLQIVGDDIFVTNKTRIQRGIDGKIANSVLIKVNQIGTLTETLESVALAQKANYTTVFSHRSGETEDSTIADLVVATGSQQIKTGSLCRGERIAKYNQLLRIEEELGASAQFWGRSAFRSN